MEVINQTNFRKNCSETYIVHPKLYMFQNNGMFNINKSTLNLFKTEKNERLKVSFLFHEENLYIFRDDSPDSFPFNKCNAERKGAVFSNRKLKDYFIRRLHLPKGRISYIFNISIEPSEIPGMKKCFKLSFVDLPT